MSCGSKGSLVYNHLPVLSHIFPSLGVRHPERLFRSACRLVFWGISLIYWRGPHFFSNTRSKSPAALSLVSSLPSQPCPSKTPRNRVMLIETREYPFESQENALLLDSKFRESASPPINQIVFIRNYGSELPLSSPSARRPELQPPTTLRPALFRPQGLSQLPDSHSS